MVHMLALLATLLSADRTPAFPSAEGYGAYARGGRGGQVLFVTNLQDYVPRHEQPIAGSLRAACDAKGPRIILFRTSGTISLKAPLRISEPFVTIAGQSAPGGGICVKGDDTTIGTHDVVVRCMRFRPGDEGCDLQRESGRHFEPDAISVGK